MLAPLGWFFALTAGFQQQPAQVAITHVTVVNVESGRLEPDQTVLIYGRRIEALGPAASIKWQGATQVIEGRGKFLIPGLWDMHVHAAFPGLDALFLPVLLANGITGVREMFSSMPWRDSARAKVARGEIAGPRIVGSGHILDGTPAIWPGSVAVKDAAEARHAVDSLQKAGADFIKVYSRLTREEYFAAAAESRSLGIPFAGHVPTMVTAAEASDSGQLSVEHLTQLLSGCSSREAELLGAAAAAVASPKGWDSAGVVSRGQVDAVLTSFDAERCQALARRFVKNGTWMVPTITVLHSVAFLDDTTLARDPRLKYVPAGFSASWNPQADFRFRMMTPADWAKRKQAYARQLEIVALFRKEGVRFLAGTDLANPYVFPGFSLHDELVSFVAAGMSPLEALRSATLSPAVFLRATDSLGTVAAGKQADLVLLDADPLRDIRNAARISAVIAGGMLYERPALDRLLSDAVPRAARPPGQ